MAEQQSDFQNCIIPDEEETSPQHYQSLTVNLSGGGGVGGIGPMAANSAIIQQPTLNQPSNRYSYRAAIYRSEAQQDLG